VPHFQFNHIPPADQAEVEAGIANALADPFVPEAAKAVIKDTLGKCVDLPPITYKGKTK
jgi:hypothetical protein